MTAPANLAHTITEAPLASAEPVKDIILAFSGGGFRATLYHLGVVRYLCQTGLLERVNRVVSVSGGSILAAHLVLNWEKYKSLNTFDNAAKELVGFTQKNVRARIIQRWITTTVLGLTTIAVLGCMLHLYRNAHLGYGLAVGAAVIFGLWYFRSRATTTSWWRFIVPILALCLLVALGWGLYTYPNFMFSWGIPAAAAVIAFAFVQYNQGRTDLLQREYSSLFRRARLSQLKGACRPRLELLCTSLTSGGSCWFTDTGFFYEEEDRRGAVVVRERFDVNCDAEPVALAVAASSAFTPFFPEVRIQYDSMRLQHRLTDGGVFDNLGLEAACNFNDQIPPTGTVIVSDAEGPFDLETTKHDHRAMRSSYILMKRVCDDVKRRYTTNCTRCPIAEVGQPPEVSNEVPRRVAKIRTDLNHFNDDEVYALTLFGFWAARQKLSDITSQIVAPWAYVVGETRGKDGKSERREKLETKARNNQLKLRDATFASEGLSTLGGFIVPFSWVFVINLVLLATTGAAIAYRIISPPTIEQLPFELKLANLGAEAEDTTILDALEALYKEQQPKDHPSAVGVLRVTPITNAKIVLPYEFGLICNPGYLVAGTAFTADAQTLKLKSIVGRFPLEESPRLRVPRTEGEDIVIVVCRVQASAKGGEVPADLTTVLKVSRPTHSK
jgi:predicted acylesterase/phospholipase RssA